MDASLEGILRSGDKNDAAAAARALEAYFLRQVFAELRKSSDGGLLGQGMAGSTFQEMLDGAMADQMAMSGGVGLARTIEEQLSGLASAQRAEAGSETPRVAPPAASLSRGGYHKTATALSVNPLPGVQSSSFGKRVHPIDGEIRYHTGMDMAAPEGTPVRAAGAGVVVQAGRAGGYGNMVVIDHGGGLETRYAHLSGIDVREGQRIPAGAPLGRVGSTGRSTGPHLHLEVRRDGQPIDPTGEISSLRDP